MARDPPLEMGQGRKSHAVHRAVWAPGVANRSEATEFVNSKIIGLMEAEKASCYLDLGCGVGGTVLRVARSLEALCYGVTVSGVQADLGQRLVNSDGLGDRAIVVHGDMTSLSSFAKLQGLRASSKGATGGILAAAVESYVHLTRPGRFFDTLSQVLTEGDLLVICDDFLATEQVEPARARAVQRNLARFREGWLAGNLATVAAAADLAGRHGFQFEGVEDLTPYLELRRPRDRAIRLVLPLTKIVPGLRLWHGSLAGGDALQRCLAAGVVAYRFALFRRTATAEDRSPHARAIPRGLR